MSNKKCKSAKIMKERLQERGWCKGVRHNHDGKSCLLGLMEADYGSCFFEFPLYIDIYEKCLDILGGETIADTYNGFVTDKKGKPAEVIVAVNNQLLDEEKVYSMIEELVEEYC